jgi:hypothetical protein
MPEHALLIVEERLREHQAEGVRLPEGMDFDGLALRVLIAAETGRPTPPALMNLDSPAHPQPERGSRTTTAVS